MPSNQPIPLDLIQTLRAFFFAIDQSIVMATGKTITLEDGTPVESGGLAPIAANYVVTSSDPTLTSERVLTAGSGIDITVGAGTVTIANTAAVIPSGLIAIWSGSIASIPSGWSLCDGTGATVDLRDKMVIGAGSTYSVGATGGSTTVTSSNHTHGAGSYATDSDAHTHGIGTYATASDAHTHGVGTYATAATTHSHGLSGGVLGTGISFVVLDFGTTTNVATASHVHDDNFSVDNETTHTHGLSGSSASDSHSHSLSGSSASDSHSHSVTGSSGSGGSESLNILNPYMALAFIQKD